MDYFLNTQKYISSIDINSSDPLDKIVHEFLNNEESYERASQALRRRFVRGAEIVDGRDRGEKATKIKRAKLGGKFHYYIEGQDGTWNEPDERIWVVAMYALWQRTKSN